VDLWYSGEGLSEVSAGTSKAASGEDDHGPVDGGLVVGGEVLTGAVEAAGIQATVHSAYIPDQRQTNTSFGELTHAPVNVSSMQNPRRRHIHISGSGRIRLADVYSPKYCRGISGALRRLE
jgi:hypothetical protein